MENKYNTIAQFYPAKDSWRIKVRATRLWEAINPNTNKLMTNNIILLVEQDNHIHVVLGKNQKHYMTQFVEGKIYSTNLKIFSSPENYKPILRHNIIKFTFKTTIKELKNDDFIPLHKFEFAAERQLINLISFQLCFTINLLVNSLYITLNLFL